MSTLTEKADQPAAPDANGRRITPFRTKDWRRRFVRDRALLLMAVPALVLFLLFSYVPLLGNVIAFQDYLPFIGISQSPFVGLANFASLFQDTAFWRAVGNTLAITAMNLVLFFPVPIGLAIMLDGMFADRIKKIVQGVVFLPHFISWVVIVTLFTQVLGTAGIVSHALQVNGFAPLDIIGNPSAFKLVLVSQVIWKDAGWGCVIFVAALSGIDPQRYESAAIDGAGYWRRMWHVTLPGIRPTIVILLILRLGDALSVGFEQVVLQRDSVGPEAGDVLDTYTYFFGVVGGNWSVAAAAGLFKGVIGLTLVLGANKVAHMLGEEGVYTRR